MTRFCSCIMFCIYTIFCPLHPGRGFSPAVFISQSMRHFLHRFPLPYFWLQVEVLSPDCTFSIVLSTITVLLRSCASTLLVILSNKLHQEHITTQPSCLLYYLHSHERGTAYSHKYSLYKVYKRLYEKSKS